MPWQVVHTSGEHTVHLQNRKGENWPGATPVRKANLVGSVGNKGVTGNKGWTHKATCGMIPTLWHFGKGETMKTVKRLVVVRGCKGGRNRWGPGNS